MMRTRTKRDGLVTAMPWGALKIDAMMMMMKIMMVMMMVIDERIQTPCLAPCRESFETVFSQVEQLLQGSTHRLGLWSSHACPNESAPRSAQGRPQCPDSPYQ